MEGERADSLELLPRLFGPDGEVYYIDRPCTIGRSMENEVVLGHDGVSRVHAHVKPLGNLCQISDLNSHNGTYVNGHVVTRPFTLHTGDQVQIGPCRLEFRAGGRVSDSEHGARTQSRHWFIACSVARVMAEGAEAENELRAIVHGSHGEWISMEGVYLGSWKMRRGDEADRVSTALVFMNDWSRTRKTRFPVAVHTGLAWTDEGCALAEGAAWERVCAILQTAEVQRLGILISEDCTRELALRLNLRPAGGGCYLLAE